MPILTAEERIGTTLADRYRIDAILGEGGMGVVFAGEHTLTGRKVATKRRLRAWQFYRRPDVRAILADDSLDR